MEKHPFDSNLARLEQDIKSCFEKGFKQLSFQNTIEKRYDDQDRPRRKRRYLTLGFPALLFYTLFGFTDKMILPDIYQTAWAIRFGIVTPAFAAALIAIKLSRFERHIDHLVGLALFITSASICLMLLVSNHPNVVHYYTGIIIIVTAGNIVVRQPFRHAVAYSLAIFVTYAVSARFFTLMPLEAINNSTLVIFTSVVISLIGNYQMEIEKRRDFLLTTLQHINSVKLEAANLELEKLSISDPLTGLFNRRHFNATLEREWYAAARNRYPLSLIYLDIDFFKPYNDNYGHGAGDQCLQKISEALKKNVRRAQDVLARYGGEEFVVLLPRADQHQAHSMAENIRQAIERMAIDHAHSKAADHITVSLGVASMVPAAGLPPDHLLDMADRALYTAKEAGRNQTRINKNGSGG